MTTNQPVDNQPVELSQDNLHKFFTNFLHQDEIPPSLINNSVLPTRWYSKAAEAAYIHFSIADVIPRVEDMDQETFVAFDQKLAVLPKDEDRFRKHPNDPGTIDEYSSYLVFVTTLRRYVQNLIFAQDTKVNYPGKPIVSPPKNS